MNENSFIVQSGNMIHPEMQEQTKQKINAEKAALIVKSLYPDEKWELLENGIFIAKSRMPRSNQYFFCWIMYKYSFFPVRSYKIIVIKKIIPKFLQEFTNFRLCVKFAI